MFDKLKKAFSSAAKGIGQKEITENLLDDTLLDLQIALLESDVAQEVVDYLSDKLKKELLGLRLEKNQDVGSVVQAKLQQAVAEIFANAGRFDLMEKINLKKATKMGPYAVVFLGINGTGKTTTVAKVANILRRNGFSVVVAAGDTHRAGAIEQLTQHASKLSLKVIAQRYGADPSAVGRDAVEHARKNHVDAVLIDTAGRMQTSKNLMDEMSKIVRVVKPDAKLFIGDSLAGNDTINQAREFFQYTAFDGAILTKIDADAKGGSAISIAHITSKPIAFIGIGQGYDDLIPFDPDKFIESLFGRAGEISVKDLMSTTTTTTTPQPFIDSSEKQVALSPSMTKENIDSKIPKPAVISSPTSPIGIFSSKTDQKSETSPSNKPPQSLHDISNKKPVVSEPDIVQRKIEEPSPEIPSSSSQTNDMPTLDQPQTRTEPQKEKKGRFGFFSRKKNDNDRRKEEDEKRRREEERARKELEDQKSTAESEEQGQEIMTEEKQEVKEKGKDDQDRTPEEKDKVIYLTDEDIEDLLK
jgi:fused signal recognition particle receptor